ncbi:phosphogluconate dehydratase [Vitreoscilla massiliensis]|uniref:Phosphogluconate dehydratase n=1 Tax=Vitreoscilla massiliensis TaxID=1689272 RepID=A0ABY4E4Z7_9NEIS|nr:phosphogluconate dehydratase [Vitreoscilla massiliensis]UOO89388.1 phosphogluconate dehydratase [Vitreoscilla massiliensis]
MSSVLNADLARITERIRARSANSRRAYLDMIASMRLQGKLERSQLSCTNLAHAFAAMPNAIKIELQQQSAPNIAIVSAYNDMLSAHQPLQAYPDIIKQAALSVGATAQFAGGTPAMCDGVTQGQAGMELSLFSRDVIAMSTAVALSHQMFDAALYLGVCDKIVPGLLIGALSFGHLPALFVPAGPMETGISNDEKAKVRQLYATGQVGREALLASEAASYHSAGTCTFYGTANSNQMLMEIMGLHLPASAFVHPNTELRTALVKQAAIQAASLAKSEHIIGVGEMIDERSIVNAIVGLMATGGSTNHTLHLVAIARAAGIRIDWSDFDDISNMVPLLARVYPNGKADVNQFHAAGGIAFIIRELLDSGLLHEDVRTVMGTGLRAYAQEPFLQEGQLVWRDVTAHSLDDGIVRPVNLPFANNGGLKLLQGNLGRAVIKVSAVAPENRIVEAPAVVFTEQAQVIEAFKRGELNRDCVVVLRFQGPRANGMPELHQLTPQLSVLQNQGYKVALVTDGRMSGASGKVPAAIHLTPEALLGGTIAKIQDGDIVRLNAETGELSVLVADALLQQRPVATVDLNPHLHTVGRRLFAGMRQLSSSAETGAMSFGGDFN